MSLISPHVILATYHICYLTDSQPVTSVILERVDKVSEQFTYSQEKKGGATFERKSKDI